MTLVSIESLGNTPPMSAAPLSLPRHKLTVADYYRMAEAGILAPDARVELINGEIIDMAPIGTRHSSTVDKLNGVLSSVLAGHAIVRIQNPVRLDNLSEPEPDVALLRPRTDFYRHAHPMPADVLLVIEIADTSLAYDRYVKIPLYAASGIREAWIVDLAGRRIHLFREPRDGEYRQVSSVESAGIVHVGSLPQLPIDLTGLF